MIFAPHRCTYTGQSATTPNIWDLQPTSSTCSCISSVQNLQQIYRSHIWWKQAVMITEQQYPTCLHANWQICKIDTPFQVFTNQPSCIASSYTKNDQEIGAQCTLSVFHIPPAFSPIIIISNFWIFIPTSNIQGSAVTMICPDKMTGSSLFPAAISYPEVTTNLQYYIKVLVPIPTQWGSHGNHAPISW